MRRITTHAAPMLLLGVCIAAGGAGAASWADYEVVFDATWSATTHPNEFPGNPHFSKLVGALHADGVIFWEPGGLASPGMESMAETGGTSTLSGEVDQAITSGDAEAVLLGSAISSPGSTSIEFTATSDFPLLTLVTMLAPSPDWFVGVADYELFDGVSWVASDQIVLYGWDAGTDDGTTYTSANANTNPQIPIAPLGHPLSPGEPVGTFTVTLLPEPAYQPLQLAIGLLVAFSLRPRSTRKRPLRPRPTRYTGQPC